MLPPDKRVQLGAVGCLEPAYKVSPADDLQGAHGVAISFKQKKVPRSTYSKLSPASWRVAGAKISVPGLAMD